MHYLALIDNREIEFADKRTIEEAYGRGEISLETWIKNADEESDWQTVGEMFPHLAES